MTAVRPFLFPEPEAREKKPEATDLPPAITRQIEKLAGSKIAGTSFAFGGLSVSAGFIFTLDNGRKIFAKGPHPGDTAHGEKNLAQEVLVYESLDIVREISPPYLGVVSDGEEDGWMLGVWECVSHNPLLASPERVIASLKTWQRDKGAQLVLPTAREHNYISQFLTAEKKWVRLRNDHVAQKKFLDLFDLRGAAKTWFDNNIPTLCLHQSRIERIKGEEGLVHGDLRLDNILFGVDRTYVVDWPNACWGPIAFDLFFLLSNMEALGLGRTEDNLAAYSAATGIIPELEDKAAMLAALSGYFADQAYRDVPDKMPRLRWMQKSMLLAQLKAMARLGIIESPPQMAGQNQ